MVFVIFLSFILSLPFRSSLRKLSKMFCVVYIYIYLFIFLFGGGGGGRFPQLFPTVILFISVAVAVSFLNVIVIDAVFLYILLS